MNRTPLWKRTLRTASSERFLGFLPGSDGAPQEAVAVDLHYLPTGIVAGTVILLEEFAWNDHEVPALLRSLDEDFLPDVDLSSGTLTFTVVMGRVLANYEASDHPEEGRARP